MSTRGEVLVAILNNFLDFAKAREEHWYRIPVSSVKKWLKDCWPPQWLAFYQTKTFGSDAYAVNYHARVLDIQQKYRWQLLPEQPRDDEKSKNLYYQLFLEPLQRLPKPILSQRQRRIIFIPTTWQKFMNANEINDLYDDSPLENLLWAELKRFYISAERQEVVKAKKHNYILDFAIYCTSGKLDIETDGDIWHANPEKAAQDNIRDNDLKTADWEVFHFSTPQIREQMTTYCIPTIVENIKRLGGVNEGRFVPRQIDLNAPKGSYQLGLFDDL